MKSEFFGVPVFMRVNRVTVDSWVVRLVMLSLLLMLVTAPAVQASVAMPDQVATLPMSMQGQSCDCQSPDCDQLDCAFIGCGFVSLWSATQQPLPELAAPIFRIPFMGPLFFTSSSIPPLLQPPIY